MRRRRSNSAACWKLLRRKRDFAPRVSPVLRQSLNPSFSLFLILLCPQISAAWDRLSERMELPYPVYPHSRRWRTGCTPSPLPACGTLGPEFGAHWDLGGNKGNARGAAFGAFQAKPSWGGGCHFWGCSLREHPWGSPSCSSLTHPTRVSWHRFTHPSRQSAVQKTG